MKPRHSLSILFPFLLVVLPAAVAEGLPFAFWRRSAGREKEMSAPLHTFRVHKSAVSACFAATTGTAQFSHPSRVQEMR